MPRSEPTAGLRGKQASTLLLTLASAVLASTMSSAAAGSAEELAQAFCAAQLKGDPAETKPLLSPSLRKEIDEAERRNEAIAEANPGEKPPFGDGIPYRSFPDAIGTCAPGSLATVDGRLQIEVTYGFADAGSGGWSDRLRLTGTPAELRVDDIVFFNVANGTPDLTLRQVLMDAFDQ